MPRFPLLAIVLALACRPYETRVSVWAPGPDSLPSPVAHLPVVFLPYDRDSILRALEAKAPPRPHRRELDSLLTLARSPLAGYLTASWRADSVRTAMAALRAVMDTASRNSATYRDAYARFSSLADSLPRFDQARSDAQARLGRSDAAVSARLAAVRADIQRWEDSTYRDYGPITTALTQKLGRAPIHATTDDVGTAVAALARGRWWVYVRAPDVLDPEGEWYWNAPVRGTILRLDRTNAIHRIRQ